MKISDWQKSLEIFAHYFPDGEKETCPFSAEHDIIYVHLSTSDLPELSADGQALETMGWHVEMGGWARYV